MTWTWGLRLFILVCLAHFAEHVAQVTQLYVYNHRLHEAGGLLGCVWPSLVKSEALHYGYAAVMLLGLYWFRRAATVRGARVWWTAALVVQVWHHQEHLTLLVQALVGYNLCGCRVPVSAVQLLGFVWGTPADDFGGLLRLSHFGKCDCPGAPPDLYHRWTWRLLVVRRPEVHLIYNVLVMFPMMVALTYRTPNKEN